MMIAIQGLLLLIIFLCELAALAAYGYWGFTSASNNMALRIVIGVGTPLAVAVLWGTFLAPRASIPLHGLLHPLLKSVVFGAAAAALFAAGKPRTAVLFAGIALCAHVLSAVAGEPRTAP
ncbi:YrdB family protein [Paenibacillus chartarius]|uniref:YrdB family protein n=1 Tax=Paenibacillus chartarius TaxID=747481 RepID=A0ABV6DG76_9BACL